MSELNDLIAELKNGEWSGEPDFQAKLDRIQKLATPPADPLMMVRLAIQSGVVDDHLQSINGMTRRRQELLAQERISTLAEDDVVLINDTVRPALLAGARVRIIGFEKDKVKGRLLDYRSTKWREGMQITLPRTLIGEKVG